MNMRTVCLCCEATDATQPDAQLIGLAACVVQDGRITGETFQGLVQPPCAIPPSGTAAHGHSLASLAPCPTFSTLAPHWLRFAQGSHLVVWHAGFHLACLDHALTQAGYPPMHSVCASVTDLRQHMPPGLTARKRDLLAHWGLNPDASTGLQQQAQQLASLWLAMQGQMRL